MYEDYYNLSGPPFRLSPDHRFFYGSESHRKAMSYLRFGLHQGEGFIVITGNVGTGKSMLVNQLFAELDKTHIVPAQIVTSNIDADDAIRMIVAAFGIHPPAADKASLLGSLENFLTQQQQAGRRVLLIVDEAQNLPLRTLEELRMLSNFAIDGQPLFQSFLIGQPQFREVLADPALEQLRQRVIASHHLEPLSADDTRDYIEHRLRLVGWTSTPEITPDAYARIFQETGGIPRRINILCSRLLLFGALEGLTTLDGATVDAVVADLADEVATNAFPTAGNQPIGHGGGLAIRRRRLNGESDDPLDELLHRLDILEARIQSHERTLRQLMSTAIGFMAGARPVNGDHPDDMDEEDRNERH